MEVSDQFHVSSSLSPRKETFTNCTLDCAGGGGGGGEEQSVWTIWKTETSPSHARNRTAVLQTSRQAPGQCNDHTISVIL
jgi:hypothetical protein